MMSRAPALEGGDSGREPRLLTAVVYGFTAAVVMWFVGFVTHLPAIGMPAWLVGAVMTLVQLETGVRIGRRYRGGSCAGIALMAGLVTSIINLLIVGAVVATPGKDQPNALQTGWPWVVAGTLAFGPVICLIGSGIGRFERSSRVGAAPTIEKRPWSVDALLSRFAVVCAIAALPVLLSGGIVTSTKSGLAVPDWPTTYRAAMFLYPLADMTGGIYYEHAHRLFGSLVGLCVLTFFVLALVYDRRAKSVSLALIALLAVIGQGVLGGVRVTMASAAAATVGGDASPASTLDNSSSLFLAFVHGITGQLTFGLLVLIAAVLSPRWNDPASTRRPDGALRFFASALLVLTLIQLGLGAAARHFEHVAFIHSHAGFALFVLIAGLMTAFRAIGKHKDERILRKLGHGTLHTLVLQVLLGVASLVLVLVNRTSDPPSEVIVTTAHQLVGAMLLGMAVLMFAWTRKLVAPGRLNAM